MRWRRCSPGAAMPIFASSSSLQAISMDPWMDRQYTFNYTDYYHYYAVLAVAPNANMHLLHSAPFLLHIHNGAFPLTYAYPCPLVVPTPLTMPRISILPSSHRLASVV